MSGFTISADELLKQAGGDPGAASAPAPQAQPQDPRTFSISPDQLLQHANDTATQAKAAEKNASAKPLEWADVPAQALQNAPSDAVQVVNGVAQAVAHPLVTAGNLGNLFDGAVSNIPGVTALNQWAADNGLSGKYDVAAAEKNKQMAGVVGQQLHDQYLTEDGLKHSLAEHPVNTLLDASSVLDGGASLIKTLPEAAGLARVAATANKFADVINPAKQAGNLVTKVGSAATQGVGLLTGTGSDAIKEAAKAGYAGGSASTDFMNNLTGKESRTAVVADSLKAAENMVGERRSDYLQNMASTKSATAPISPVPIYQTYIDMKNSLFAAGQTGLPISKPALAKMNEIGDLLTKWSQNEVGHTAIGLDGLKQAIYDLMPAITDKNANATRVVTAMYNSVKDAIVQQVPEYAKAMSDYEAMSEELGKTKKFLANGNEDVALRRLQSSMRDNANTNYGARVGEVNKLQDFGAANLKAKLAGQMLSSYVPRGIAKLGPILTGGIPTALATGGLASGGAAALAGVPLVAMSSPHFVGRVAHMLGHDARVAGKVPNRLLNVTGQLNSAVGGN